jgi:CheY-like chemotaxis protein
VADDNEVNLKVAGAMLRKLGYDIQTATDGREAVAMVAQSMARGQPFGAILMDINMPNMDGLEATRQILAEWDIQAPPVIALTAAALPEDQARCEAAGMVGYLTKPLHVAALAQSMDKWVVSPALSSPDAGAVGKLARASATASEAEDAAMPLMDASRLEEFLEFDDARQTLTREVVGLFVADAPLRLSAIRAAITASDALALSVAAHALKGAASNIGAAALQAVCDRLEEDARYGVPPDAAARLARLDGLWEQTREALAVWR